MKQFFHSKRPALDAEVCMLSAGRVPLTHCTGMKVTAFILTVLMTALAVISGVAAAVMVDQEFYTVPERAYHDMAFGNLAEGIAANVINRVMDDEEQEAIAYCQYKNVAGVALNVSGRREFSWKTGDVNENANQTGYHSSWYFLEEGTLHSGKSHDDSVAEVIEATVYIPHQLTVQDQFYQVDRLISVGYALRDWVYVIGIAATIIAVVCFAFLLCASGRKAGFDSVQPGWGTRIPADLLTAATGLAAFLLIQIGVESTYYGYNWPNAALCSAAAIGLLCMVMGWCMSMALRIKLGGWWKNTLVFSALHMAWIVFKKLKQGIWKLGGGIAVLMREIPLVWKTVAIYAGVSLFDFCCIVFSWGDQEVFIICWILKNLILFPVILAIALMLRKLQQGGKALAAGDLNYQINTQRLVLDFKQHGEDLNRIGEGITAAVEQRMKSERMKTELITNVSHDIKTPLTSIINYSDLIEKEPCENTKITEYASVLHRQSERLKRLIEDLVEASKASTGNLEVQLAPCEVGVLLTQTAGEYEQRLEQCSLKLVTKQPEKPIKILADGRRLWRVFDNLMNNICKYAQPGTRVYLTLEEMDGQAQIFFKNTSREALDLTAEELMERFVRGDTARKSEGNGLGLSIAKSLTELQSGSMELIVDGDLFKVILRFPTIR